MQEVEKKLKREKEKLNIKNNRKVKQLQTFLV